MEAFRVRSGDAELAAVKFGAGPRTLLAHPMVFSKAYVAGGADVLGARAEVVALDLRGHGETEAATLSLDAMADDLGTVLDALGWPSAAVGGTSLGAAAALRFALRHPGRVDRPLLDLPGFGPGSARPP